jgi:hypothetical protein
MVHVVVSSARLVSLPAVVMLALALAGCEADDEPQRDSADLRYDGGHGDEECPAWAHPLSYGENGLLADNESGGAIQARVIKADFVPARKYFNAWTFELQDEDGAARPDYEVTWVCTFMPQHGHTGPTELAAGEERGQFDLGRLYFNMSGGWEVKLWVDPLDAGMPEFDPKASEDKGFCAAAFDTSRPEDLVFRVCVPPPED